MSDAISKFLIKFEKHILVAILLFGFFLRFSQLKEKMFLTYDQGRDMYVLQDISRGDIKLIGPTTGIQGLFLGPFYYYFLLPGFVIFHSSPLGVAWWNLFWITICLPITYYILKPLVGQKLALFGFFWIVIAQQSIVDARSIWNPSLTVPVMLVSLWCLFNSLKKPWLLIPSALLLGLGLQTEIAYVIFMIPLYAWWVLKYQALPLNWLKRWQTQAVYSFKVLLFALMAFSFTLLPQVVFELKNHFLMTNSVVQEMGNKKKQVPYRKVFSERPHQMHYFIGKGLFGNNPEFWQTSLLLMTGLALYSWTKHKTNQEKLIAGYFWLPLFLLLFFRGNDGNFFEYYIGPHYLPTIMLSVIALKKLKDNQWYGTGLFIIVVTAFLFYAQTVLKKETPGYSMQLMIDALKYTRQEAKTDKFAIDTWVPNLIPVQYQYLNEWLAQSGQLIPADFGRKDHKEYFIIYEPYTQPYNKANFEQWLESNEYQAECGPVKQFGITSIRHCFKK